MLTPSLPRVARATLVTALTDGLFSSVLVTLFYQSTFAKLWQGVASVLLGPAALTGGAAMVAVGLAMHVGVALAWSVVFLMLHDYVPAIRRAASSPSGALAVAALYGPAIWLVMSRVVIPTLRHAPAAPITIRWWVQLIGHVPFVAVPIVWSIAQPGRATAPAIARAPYGAVDTA